MADDPRGRGPEESQYPPPPGEEDDRSRAYHHLPPAIPSGVTLPSIHDPHNPYGPSPSGSRYPPPDSRNRGAYSASPTSTANGYNPPPGAMYNLPPVQAPTERGQYGVDSRDYYSRNAYPPAAHQTDPYSNYNAYRPATGSPYSGYGEYGRGGAVPAAPQAAPRQRTSIACKYCRKRKIRCSGFTHSGKCSNCMKTGNECVFQPVSSSSSTAFIPVSAVPGGVPPGTPLYGAFGQPLASTDSAGPPPNTGPSQSSYPPASNDYSLPSPTGSNFYPYPDDRSEAGRRRPHEEEHGPRLPPPSTFPDGDPRRRSPATSAQGGTPPTAYDYRSSDFDPTDRTPTPRRSSPGNLPSAVPGSSGGSSIMSLDRLMADPPPRPPPTSDSSHDIDQNMLGRLNRRT